MLDDKTTDMSLILEEACKGFLSVVYYLKNECDSRRRLDVSGAHFRCIGRSSVCDIGCEERPSRDKQGSKRMVVGCKTMTIQCVGSVYRTQAE